ncbi:MAG: HAMP domain-containing histidine kinase [Ruminococcus sp.]|nr:HAMP domain-containing histidine kinase [Ruminococcus sp.]
MSKRNSIFVLHKMKWTVILGLTAVFGGLFSYGIIYFFMAVTDNYSSASMIGMIPMMCVIIGVAMYFVITAMERRLKPLLDGLQKIADGDLDVRLDTENAGEYELIYQNFNAMAKELKATKEEMQSFINEFTHEFKTPITSISGFADVLYQTGEGIENEERMEFLKVISEQSHRLSNLAQNTLLLSKVEATQIITEKETFSLSEQIKRCAIMLLPQMEKKHITLDIAEDLDFSYYGNEELMEQIWINLLNNAVKFTPEGGEIFIFSKQTGDKLIVSIKDSGSGMDEDTISHIFEKYYQNDTASIVKGNGIGLSIVKRIVELCEGSIEVESAPGKGSVFSVVFKALSNKS